MERKKHPLWWWGLMLIVGGACGGGIINMIDPIQPPLSPGQRAELLGRGIAILGVILTGVVLIVVHLVRSRRGKTDDTSAPPHR